MRKLYLLLILCSVSAFAQVAPPQINLSGNIGAQGFPVLNSGVLQFTSDANRNMTVQETSATGGIKVTSTVSLTATRNLVLPVGNFQFIAVENATTGGQSIQVIGQSGTGVTIANGASATVWFDGTNVVQTGSSGSDPGGTTGAGQYNNAGTLGGINGTGYFYLNGASAPTVAHPFSSTVGGVYNTSADASRNMTASDIDTMLGYTPGIAPNFTNDFIACYLFTETATSGGSLPDHCGNNNGTVGTLAPVSTGTGWQFSLASTSPVVLPAALNNAKTFYFAVLNPPAVGGGWAAAPNDNTLLGNTVAGNLNIFNTNSATQAQALSSFSTWQNGVSFITQIPDVFSGVTIITLVCGPNDAVYINGHSVQNTLTGDSCGRMTSGSFEIGGSADNSNFLSISTFYDLRVSNNAHTAAQVAQNVNAMNYELTGRGVLLIPNRYIYPTQQLFFAGDSITCGFLAGGSPSCVAGSPYAPGTTSSLAFTNIMTLDQTFGITNFGVPNAIIQQQVSAAPALYAPLCSTQNGSTIAAIFEGTNNFTAAWKGTPAQVWNYAVGWNTIMKQAGCKTVFISMISRGGTAWNSTSYETYRYQYTALARANWKQAGFDAFVDEDSDPFLGCTGCNANTTYFNADLTHPTAVGQQKLALGVQATINYISAGSTPSNPNPIPVTTATYTSSYEDGGLIFDTAANSIVDTLTSAQWMSGRIISRCNNSTSGSHTLTITAPSDYPFNNVSGFTTVIVPNGSCQKFQATFIAGTPNGDFWSIVPTSPTTGPFTNGNLRTTTAGVAADSGIASSNVPLLNASNIYGVSTFQHLANGDYEGTFGAKTDNIATSSANYASGPFNWTSNVWNGTTSVQDNWSIQPVLGGGANPSTTLVFSHGSSATGPAVVSMPNLTTTVYTVATLPSASSLPAGTQVTVSDDTGLPTSNTCTGSGTEYAIAITNGTTWTCH